MTARADANGTITITLEAALQHARDDAAAVLHDFAECLRRHAARKDAA